MTEQESIRQLKEQHEQLKLRYNDEQQRKFNLEAALEQDKAVIEQLTQRIQATEQVAVEYSYRAAYKVDTGYGAGRSRIQL